MSVRWSWFFELNTHGGGLAISSHAWYESNSLPQQVASAGIRNIANMEKDIRTTDGWRNKAKPFVIIPGFDNSALPVVHSSILARFGPRCF